LSLSSLNLFLNLKSHLRFVDVKFVDVEFVSVELVDVEFVDVEERLVSLAIAQCHLMSS